MKDYIYDKYTKDKISVGGGAVVTGCPDLHRWTHIAGDKYGPTTHRMAVPGGWIYLHRTDKGDALVFVPEPVSQTPGETP